jgi:hypothetical protein
MMKLPPSGALASTEDVKARSNMEAATKDLESISMTNE